MQNQRLKAILDQHGLPHSFVYLAPAFPIVQVMWADGVNQLTEQTMICKHIRSHCSRLSEMAGGLEVIGDSELVWFEQEFIYRKPSKEVLQSLTDAALEGISDSSSDSDSCGHNLYDHKQLMKACMEIAAACTVRDDRAQMSGFPPDRIYEEEQRLIEELMALVR